MNACRLAAASLLLAIAGCPGVDLPVPGASGETFVSITSPADGARIASSSVRLQIVFQGGDRYHVYVDGAARGQGTGAEWLLTDLGPGDHEISVRLFDSAQQPVARTPPAAVRITVPEDAPRVSIVSPLDGAEIASSSVELLVELAHYPSGRWQAYVDDLAGEVRGEGSDVTAMVTRMDPGNHKVFVRLHHSDGTPYDPEVVDRVAVVVPFGSPSVTITAPADGEAVGTDPAIHVETQNFVIDQFHAGGANEPGHGHFHVYVGGYDSSHMWQEGYWPDVTVDGLPPGTRDVYVRLMNNDHTSIEPKIVDRVRLNVQ